MKKLSKIEASKRILKIAKSVAQVEAFNVKLSSKQIDKIQQTIGVILASTDIDEETLNEIEALENEEKEDKE